MRTGKTISLYKWNFEGVVKEITFYRDPCFISYSEARGAGSSPAESVSLNFLIFVQIIKITVIKKSIPKMGRQYVYGWFGRVKRYSHRQKQRTQLF